MKLKTIKLNRIVSLTVIASLVSIIVLPFVSHEVVADYIQPLWQQSSNSVYTDLTSVGIGDSTPDTGTSTLLLDVEGAIGATEYCDENGNNCTAATSLGGSSYTAGTGLNLTGTTFSIADTAATAGSYTNADVTVNAQGQITAVANGTDNDTIVSPADANGAVQFNNSGSFGGDAGNLFWDNTSKELGIGTNNPNQKLAVVGDSDFNGNFAVGANGIVNANEVINVEENFNVDATTYQIRSTTTQTSPLLTGDRISYGAYFDVIDNKTEDTATGRDSDATAGYFRARSNNASPTFRTIRGVQSIAANYSNQTTNLGGLYGGDFSAQNLDSAGVIPTATAMNLHTRGDTTVGGTSRITTASGAYSTIYAYESDITNAYSGYFRTQTNNGDAGNITSAYGVYGDTYADSDDGATITTGRGGYFTVRKRGTLPGVNSMTTAVGVDVVASGGTTVYGTRIDANTGVTSGTTVYGARIDTDDATATTNYGLYIDSAGATTNYGIYGQRGNWILADAAGDVGIGDTTPDLALRLDVEGQIGATEYCDNTGNNCVAAGSLGTPTLAEVLAVGNTTGANDIIATGRTIDQAAFYDVQSGTGNGIRFWNTDAYKVSMGDDADYHYGPVTSHSIKSNMGGANRGFTWGTNGNVPTAALTNTGTMQLAANLYAMGNAGIGTSAPATRLQLGTDGGGQSNYMTIGKGWDTHSGINWQRGGLLDAQIRVNASEDFIFETNPTGTGINGQFVFQNNNTNIARITPAGLMAIGAAAPTAALHIQEGTSDASPNVTGIQIANGANPSIEMTSNGGRPYIDFQNDISGTDMDMRIILEGNDMMQIGGGNLGIGTATPGERLTVDGNIYAVDGTVGSSDSGLTHISQPVGAALNGSGTQTGAIKIELPNTWTNTMMKMNIEVYDYTTNESITVKVGGYTYATGTSWYNTSAQIIAAKVNRDFTVRFGHDGTHCAIWIGETTSTWSYPKVSVTDFLAGHSAATFDNWDDGWDITIDNSFTGDTMTRTHDNNLVGLWLANGDDIYKANPANVGIGITTPGSELHVYENSGHIGGSAGVTVQNAGTGDARLGLNLAATQWTLGADNSDGDKLKIGDNTAIGTGTVMTMETNGEVGIGTTTPSEKLEVSSSSANTFSVHRNASNIGYGSVMDFKLNDNTGAKTSYGRIGSIITDNTNGSEDGGLYFQVMRAGVENTNVMRIQSDGKVGINKTDPVSNFHIYENNTTTGTGAGLTIEQDGTGDAVAQFLTTGLQRWVVGIDNSSSGKFRFATSANVGTDSKVTIEPGGDVGIGTTNPTSKLHVVGGPINADDGLIIETLASDPASPQDGRVWLVQ